jgi:DNA-binding NarL/FixJ family response regulator
VTATRVLIADDQQLVRAGFRMILAHEPRITVVGEASDGIYAVAAARGLTPDVVLMDVRMPRMDGIEATRQITSRTGAPAVLVLTTFDLDEYVYRALSAGASGFLLKDAPQEQLVTSVLAAAAGSVTFTPAVAARMAARFGPASDQAADRYPALARLTSRERDVLMELAAGRSNGEIARRLYLGENTVKSHVAGLLTKLDLHSRTQAVIVAYESGLMDHRRDVRTEP